MTNKDLDYYLNLDWTLIEGTDLDFNGNPYHYIEIKEIPSFAFCAKTREKALENYKTESVHSDRSFHSFKNQLKDYRKK